MSDTRPTLVEQIAALDAERAAIIAKRAPVDARLRQLYDARQKLVEQLATTADPSTEEGLEALWRAAWNDGIGTRAGSERLDACFASFAPEIGGHAWHQAPGSGQVFPSPRLALTRGQDVRALATGLLALVRRLARGRAAVYVSLLDRGLSRYAVYGIDVSPATGSAVLHATSYGRRSELLAGPLAEVLARAAREHWYQREPGATDTDEDELD